ncbi:zinc-finger homeodomain protein 4-like [Malania oleifera]|uniref:zinc-finger homeodomain protein 4-like n=1 Tax=Malania oleifera TaxID=397392 RepID=UPI0025ADCBC8|nr:zinc-finger homeodomain protein 4-like [Malania oleifera]
MELSSQEEEIPIPISSTYGGEHGRGHVMHHDDDMPIPSAAAAAAIHTHTHIVVPSSSAVTVPQIIPSSNSININMNGIPRGDLEERNKKVVIRYRECLKNHAAAMGGNATDGCGEFMPSGEEGTLEALNCSACNCHRNFHRKEVEGHDHPSSCDQHCHPHLGGSRFGIGRKLILGRDRGHHHHQYKTIFGPSDHHHQPLGYPTVGAGGGAAAASHGAQMVMPYNYNYNYNMAGAGSLLPNSESDHEQEDGDGGGGVVVARPTAAAAVPQHHQLLVNNNKKRFRTKFTQEQKDKMLSFAEKVGWKIQKQEEAAVQHFCQEIGVKRRVLKVWMHNNKHNLANKNPHPQEPTTA